jgi:hypothetical protein
MKASIVKEKVSLVIALTVALSMILPASVMVVGEKEGRDYFFVDFRECPVQSMLDEIAALGGYAHQYYNGNRYLMDIDAGQLAEITALPYVSGVKRYEPSDKLSETLVGLNGAVTLRVRLHNNADVEKVSDSLAGLGVDIKFVNTHGINYLRCMVDSSLIDAISNVKEVRWIELAGEPQTFMNLISSNPYMGHDTPQLAGFNGGGVLAEVQDNGCDADIIVGTGNGHPDLSNVIYTDFNPSSSDHGTCTSGIMFSTGLSNMQAQGILPSATGAFADWMNGNYITIQHLWEGDFDQGNVLLNGIAQTNSWYSGGTMNGQYADVSHEIDLAAWDYPRVLNHWACGNSNQGEAEGMMSWESISKNDVSVGAIFHMDTAVLTDDDWHSNGMGATPSRGPAADGRVKPDMCGPFDWIYTTDEEPGGYVGGMFYNDFGGTSGACPNIAGSSCLIYDMYEANYFGNNPLHEWPYSCTVKAMLIADAQQYPMPNPDLITRNVQGWGTPDLENVYNLGADYHVIDQYPQAMTAGGTWTRTVSVDGSHPLKVTLCWIDPPAAESTGSGRALANNLDLHVTTPMLTTYWGNNGLDNDTWSLPGTGPNRWSIPAYGSYRDDRNNVENVFIQNPFPGLYTIQVHGRAGDFNNGTMQQFSVVCSGAREGEPPTASLVQPNGGESWKVGDLHDITWNMSDTEDPVGALSVTLDYSTDGGATYPYNIITDQTGFSSPGTYSWQIPNTPTVNAKVRIKVTDTYGVNVTDTSNNTFNITMDLPFIQVTRPAGGEYFLGGGSEPITWIATAGTNPLTATPITITYSTTGAGGPWNPLASNEPNDGTYTWNPVPAINNPNCYVRITAIDTMGYTGSDMSDTSFTIDSIYPLPATNPRAELTGTNDVTISWTASVSVDVANYRIYYASNGWDSTGNSYILLPGSTTTNTYFVHSAAGNNSASEFCYQVRTYDYAGHVVKTYIQVAKYTKIISASGTVAWGGWIPIGSFLTQSSYAISHKLQGQGFGTQGFYNWSAVELYNAWDNTNHWKFNLRNGTASLNEITTINNTQAFWLCAYNSARYSSAGYITNMTVPLKSGWNLVPYPFSARNLNTMQIRDHLIANCPGFGGTYNDMEIMKRDSPYRLIAPTGTEIFNHQDAFWVRVSADTIWTVINY